MAPMKAALTEQSTDAMREASRLAAVVISPWTAVFRACKFPGLRRKSERLTPH
jgi:hypothetical protein